MSNKIFPNTASELSGFGEPLQDGWKEDGSDLTERGLILEIFITVDTEGWVRTTNRGAPCEDFSKMRAAYESAALEINEFIERGARDCPFSGRQKRDE